MELYGQALQVLTSYLEGTASLARFSNTIHEIVGDVMDLDPNSALYCLILGMVHDLAMHDSDLFDEETLRRHLRNYLP